MSMNLISSIGALLLFCVFLVGSYNSGRESIRFEILEQCQNHQPVTIDGIEIHCGVIHKDVNQEAAKYRSVKQCVKLIGAWNDEQ
jgi:hypothetical protein